MLRLVQIIDNISDYAGKVLSGSIIIITVILVFEVIMRYLFNDPTIWVHEVSGFIFVIWFMFGGSYALRHKAHVNVDLMYSRLKPRGKAILNIFTSMFVFLICWSFLWFGSKAAWGSLISLERSNTVWAPPFYPVKILIVIALIMFTLQVLADFIRSIYVATGSKIE